MSSRDRGGNGDEGEAPAARAVLLVVLLGLVARTVAAVFAAPSDDLLAWAWVGRVLAAGGNPYEETPRLNWPPLWMLWIGVADFASRTTHLAFGAVVRVLPFVADAVTTALLARLAIPLGIAFAIHPVALATTGAQAQFDAVPALASLLAVLAVTTRIGAADAIAGVSLGLGAGFKTWPLFLAPTLALRLGSWRERARLLAIAIGIPVFLCLPIAALAPRGFRENVLHYASWPGWWGLTATGVLFGAGFPRTVAAFAAEHGRALLIVAMAASWLASLRLPTREAAVATLLAFLVFTPGFGPQYLLWIVPLSLLLQGRMVHLWNAAAAVSTVTERWLVPSLVDPALRPALAAMETNRLVNVCRFPLWMVSAVWLGVLLARAARRGAPAAVPAGGERRARPEGHNRLEQPDRPAN